MTVQCPNCGHSGTLPPNMESGQHKVRCRRCGVEFETQPKEADQKVDAEPEIDPKGLSELATELGIEPEFQSEEEDSAIGVGDLKIDVSDDDLPVPTEPRATLPPEPWYYGFLHRLGVFYFFAAGVVFIFAFVLFGLSVLRVASDGRQHILYSIIDVAFFVMLGMFLVTSSAAIFLIVDQARNVRRLQFRIEQIEKP
jgi:Zn ribbon nucleic-acid-binding protein